MLGKFGLAALGSACLLLVGLAYSQDEDLFSFIPQGGRTLLADLSSAGLSGTVQQAVQAGGMSGTEWLDYLDAQAGSDPALAALDESQRQTLADYLGYNAPISLGQANADPLPPDGRDLALQYCQSCHITHQLVSE